MPRYKKLNIGVLKKQRMLTLPESTPDFEWGQCCSFGVKLCVVFPGVFSTFIFFHSPNIVLIFLDLNG